MQIDAMRALLLLNGKGIYESYTGRSRWKAGWGNTGENMKEEGNRMNGADEERDKKRDGGVKAAKGGHC